MKKVSTTVTLPPLVQRNSLHAAAQITMTSAVGTDGIVRELEPHSCRLMRIAKSYGGDVIAE